MPCFFLVFFLACIFSLGYSRFQLEIAQFLFLLPIFILTFFDFFFLQECFLTVLVTEGEGFGMGEAMEEEEISNIQISFLVPFNSKKFHFIVKKIICSMKSLNFL